MSIQSQKQARWRIDTDLLIPGRGDPIRHATLVYTTDDGEARGQILYAGPLSAVPDAYVSVPCIAHVPVLMPGMWDCHVHLFSDASGNLDALATLPHSLSGMRSARDVAATVNAGFTSLREMGGYGIDFHAAIDEAWIPGPRIYSAGAPISQTAGHGDLHTVPLEVLQDTIKHGLPLCVVDGVDECTKAVRAQIRRGAKVIKIMATGGVMSRIDSPRAAQFTRAELEAMVGEATRTDLSVAAHAHGTEGIVAALKAGVKTIEHGSYLTPEAIELMKEKKAMLVATRCVHVWGVRNPGNMPVESYRKILAVDKANAKSYEAAIKAGIKCALGTDLGMSKAGTDFYHGMNGREFGFAIDAGMTPLQAIEAGTTNGPEMLGPQAPRSGQLKKGYDADLIALSESPLERIGVLAEVDKITHVWKGGKVMKMPGKPVGFV